MRKVLVFVVLTGLLAPNLFAAAETAKLSAKVASKAQSAQKTRQEEVSALKKEVISDFETFRKSVARVHYSDWSFIFQSMIYLRDSYMKLRRLDASAAREVAPIINTPISIDNGNYSIRVESYCNMESVMIYSESQDRADFDSFQEALAADLAVATATEKVNAELYVLAAENPSFAKEINAVKASHAALVEFSQNQTGSTWAQSLLYKVESLNEDLAALKLKNYKLYQEVYKLCNHPYGSMKNLQAVEYRAEDSLNGYGSVRTIRYYEAELIAQMAPQKEFTNVMKETVLKEFGTFKKHAANLDYYSYEAMFTALRNVRDSYMALRNANAAAAKDIAKTINTEVKIAGGSYQIHVESYVRMESVVLYDRSEHCQCAMRGGNQERNAFDAFQEALAEDLGK